jgi:hypothetical protein
MNLYIFVMSSPSPSPSVCNLPCDQMTSDDKVQCPNEAFKCCMSGMCLPTTKGCKTTWDQYGDKFYGCFYKGYDNVLDHTVNHCVDDANVKTMDALKPLIIILLVLVIISLAVTLGIAGFNHYTLQSRLKKIESNIYTTK